MSFLNDKLLYDNFFVNYLIDQLNLFIYYNLLQINK